MPKLGRRSDDGQLGYLWSQKPVTRNAPFGTTDTPTVRLKIVGGKEVPVPESSNSGKVENTGYQDNAVSGNSKQTRNPYRSKAPPKLGSMTEKPNNFDPSAFLSHNRSGAAAYASAQQDSHGSHLHQRPASPQFGQSGLNPHKLIPPITTDSKPGYAQRAEAAPWQRHQEPAPGHRQNAPPKPGIKYQHPQAEPTASDSARSSIMAKLPKQGYLPARPVAFNQEEELELRALVWDELEDFDTRKLKDLYMELTGYDQHLTGFVNYTDLSAVLVKHQVHISPHHLRSVAAQYVGVEDEGKVNYEKVLSFISASIKPPGEQHDHPGSHSTQREGVYYNPITHEEDDYRDETPSPRSKKFPYGDRNNAMMFRLMEQQMLDADEDLDFDRIYSAFGRADRDHRGKLSRKQIKTLAYTCRIPLQESLMNQIIDKCDSSNGQHDWQQFLEYIERVQPQKTGLRIPPSKRPSDFAKHYPQPSANWPHNSEQAAPEGKSDKRAAHFHRKETRDRARSPYSSEVHQESKRKGNGSQTNTEKQMLSHLENQIKDLEDSYKKNTIDLDNERHVKESGSSAWFDRFMKLGEAMYKNDSSHDGSLPLPEMQWLSREYNDIYQLNIPPTVLEKAIVDNQDGNKVYIDSLLKQLSTHHKKTI